MVTRRDKDASRLTAANDNTPITPIMRVVGEFPITAAELDLLESRMGDMIERMIAANDNEEADG